MTRTPPAVLVAIPAHDEEDLVAACLESVLAAVSAARSAGSIGPARVAVCAHRCGDATAAVARRILAGSPAMDGLVVELAPPMRVGGVRAQLIRRASAGLSAPPERTWVFNTDADSLVPTDWITGLLQTVQRTGAELVLGLADLVGWEADGAARAAYDQIIAAGLRPDGHDHVYAANLAIRLDAYQRIGGFSAVHHGEDHALAAAARAAGVGVVSVFEPRVRTSARMPGRAEAGLGDLLARLTGS